MMSVEWLGQTIASRWIAGCFHTELKSMPFDLVN